MVSVVSTEGAKGREGYCFGEEEGEGDEDGGVRKAGTDADAEKSLSTLSDHEPITPFIP